MVIAIISFQDITFPQTRALLDYMYHGEVSVQEEELPALLKIAEALKVKGLVEAEDNFAAMTSARRAAGGTGGRTVGLSGAKGGGGGGVGKVDHFPPLYVITPTYARPVQRAELTRLAQVFVMVPNLHWIVVEDAAEKTELVAKFLAESGIQHSHLHIATPSDMKIKPKDPHWSKPRGVYQRNLALQWLRDNFRVGDPGVVYFADDDNTYSVQLFGEISATRKVSVFPVGLVGGVMVERPLVASDGAVTGWSVGWGTDRPFATDMAGFAINLSYLLSHTSAKFASSVKIGYLESEFLKHLVHLEDLEAVGGGRVLVWHTRTEQPNLNKEKQFSRLHGHASDHGLVV